MKRLQTTLTLIMTSLLLSLVPANHSQAVAKPEAGARYAVVDMQRVILSVEEGKQARAQLEKEIKAKEKDLLKKKEELDKLNKDWKEQAPLLSDEAKMKKQQEFQEKFMSLRNEEAGFQAEIKRKEQMATQKIAIAVAELVNQLAEKQGFEMVFETNSAGLLYLKNPVDLTGDVIKAYEQKSKSNQKGSTAKK